MGMLKTMNKYVAVFAIIIAFIAGCATAPPQKTETVFYPSPPDLPRLQFLTSFTGEKDIASKKSAFEAFVTGSAESQRRLDKPYGVAIWSGKLYVADSNRGVYLFDLVKKTFGELPGAHGLGQLTQPINIRIAPDGTKYVADPIRGQVVVFDKNDLYVDAFGRPGTWRPVDAVPYEDDLFVADMKNFEIVVLNRKDGTPVRRFGLAEDLAQKLSRPTNLAFDREGHLFVSDIGVFKILKFDRDGHFLGALGEMGRESGTFSRPKGIAIDREQRLYVVDAAFSNVQLFNKDGNVLFAFGVTGKRPGDLDLPAQVIVDYDHIKYFQQYVDPKFDVENLVIVANQFGNHMINVYAMGKERGKRYPTDAELLEQLKERLEKAAKEKPAEKKGEPDKEVR